MSPRPVHVSTVDIVIPLSLTYSKRLIEFGLLDHDCGLSTLCAVLSLARFVIDTRTDGRIDVNVKVFVLSERQGGYLGRVERMKL